jgi:hypothetical protein
MHELFARIKIFVPPDEHRSVLDANLLMGVGSRELKLVGSWKSEIWKNGRGRVLGTV